MKVIFLDIDGVLNTTRSRYKNGMDEITPELVRNLRGLLVYTGAKIVISSTWRLPDVVGYDPLVDRLESEFGMDPECFVGQTPDLSMDGLLRGDEISSWLRDHPEVTQYVILDDVVEDLLDEQFHNIVECNESQGFDLVALAEATKILTAIG